MRFFNRILLLFRLFLSDLRFCSRFGNVSFSVLVKDAVRPLQVTRSFVLGADGRVENDSLTNVVKGNYSIDSPDCYRSSKVDKGWVTLDIPWSLVTHVNILTAESGYDYPSSSLEHLKLRASRAE